MVECFLYTEEVGSSKLSRGTRYARLVKWMIILCYERRGRGSIPLLGTKLWKVMQRGWSCDQPWKLGSQKWDGVRLLCFPPNYRELGEWLSQQFAKLSLRNRRKGSNPLLSASVRCEYGGIGRHKRLKISRLVRVGSSPTTRTSFCGISIMDNTVGFYPTNVGSIPACRTKVWAGSLMVKQSTHNRSSESSILFLPTKFCSLCLVHG